MTLKPNIKQALARHSYSLLWLLLTPVAFLHFVFQLVRRKPGYSMARLTRYGLIRQQTSTGGLLIHCASVGEVVAIQDLINQLLKKFPDQAITITTNTTTGADRVKLLFADKVSHFYLPYDLTFFHHAFLRKLQPSKVLINEMELWPNLCHVCWKKGLPLYIINGRMSEKSTKTYKKFASLFLPMFSKITHICAQGERDYQNYLALGVSEKQLTLTNNIKFDQKIDEGDITQGKELSNTFNLESRVLLVAGSTHEPEEQILLDAYLSLIKTHPELLLVLVPRHPQRFEKVHKLLEKNQVTSKQMSQQQPCDNSTQVLLCDQMGKLRALYAIGDIAYIGGSLAQRGGHNALEPAACGLPIMMGPSRYNNPAICQALAEAGALYDVLNAEQIELCCSQWLQDETAKQQAGLAGSKVLTHNSGAIYKTLQVLKL